MKRINFILVIDLLRNKINKRNEAILSERAEKRGGLPCGKPTSFYALTAKIANCSINPYYATGLISVIFITPLLVFAHAGVSLDSALSEIKTSQNVSEINQLKCEEVTDGQFEELGEGVMAAMHPDENQHELMDQMMGGEGSQSLKAAHIYMGRQYLGCVSGVSGSGMMGGGMMGMGGMMGYGGNSGGMMGYGSNYQNMMNWGGAGFGWNWIGLIFQFLFLFLVILAIAALIKWLSKK